MRTRQHLNILWSAVGIAVISLALAGCPNTWPDCASDSECEAYERGANFCIDNTCRECADDSSCDRGSECRNNSCVAIPGYCDDDSWCGAGQICENNRCRAGCNADVPCPAGSICDENNRCVDDGICESDSECGSECCNTSTGECVECTPCHDHAFETVYFDFDESIVRSDQETKLEHNVACLVEYPDENARVEGHCDERGTDAYNLALGERRARASKRFMERNGVDRDRLDTISYGESRPASSCHNESCWRQNRRTEFSWR